MRRFATLDIVPFVLADSPLVDNGYGVRMGRGVLRQVVVAAVSTDQAIAHGLNRVPLFVIPLDNGTNFVPKVKRGTVAWSTTQVTIQVDTACPSPGCWFFIV